MSPTVYTTSQPLLHKRSVGTAETPACPSAPSSSPYHGAGYSSPLCRQVTKPTWNCLFSSSTEQTQTKHKPSSSSAGQAKLSSAQLLWHLCQVYSPAQLRGSREFLQLCPQRALWRAEGGRSALAGERGAIWTCSWRSDANQLLMVGNTELSATESHSQPQIHAVMAWEHPI